MKNVRHVAILVLQLFSVSSCSVEESEHSMPIETESPSQSVKNEQTKIDRDGKCDETCNAKHPFRGMWFGPCEDLGAIREPTRPYRYHRHGFAIAQRDYPFYEVDVHFEDPQCKTFDIGKENKIAFYGKMWIYGKNKEKADTWNTVKIGMGRLEKDGFYGMITVLDQNHILVSKHKSNNKAAPDTEMLPRVYRRE